jgi:hypothetical protein
LVRASGVPYAIEAGGTLLYASADENVIENELICSIRDRVFPEWKVFTLEGDEMSRPQTTARYRAYMKQHGIPFVEEVVDGFIWFLIPQDQDSFEWGVPDSDEPDPGAAADRAHD